MRETYWCHCHSSTAPHSIVMRKTVTINGLVMWEFCSETFAVNVLGGKKERILILKINQVIRSIYELKHFKPFSNSFIHVSVVGRDSPLRLRWLLSFAYSGVTIKVNAFFDSLSRYADADYWSVKHLFYVLRQLQIERAMSSGPSRVWYSAAIWK